MVLYSISTAIFHLKGQMSQPHVYRDVFNCHVAIRHVAGGNMSNVNRPCELGRDQLSESIISQCST